MATQFKKFETPIPIQYGADHGSVIAEALDGENRGMFVVKLDNGEYIWVKPDIGASIVKTETH